ncbi:MAG: lysophospholipid acyltransferase family protein [Rikenellaceae bacterium]
MKSKELNIFQKIALEILWCVIFLLSMLPHCVRFGVLAPFVAFVVRRVGYRKEVVRDNIKNSFPEKSADELQKIERRFYTILSEVMVSFISLASPFIKRDFLYGDYIGENAKQFREEITGKNWISLTSHFGLWEYYSLWPTFSGQTLIGVYHRLQNPLFDALFKRLRALPYVVTVPLQDTVRFTMKHRDGVLGRNFTLGLIADQSPIWRPDPKWYRFLNQDTIFYDGGEKIALKLSLPAYFIYQERVAPGRYLFVAEKLYDGVEQVDEGEITRRYIAALEALIRKNPEMWLWSHRRWKHKRE